MTLPATTLPGGDPPTTLAGGDPPTTLATTLLVTTPTDPRSNG
jgi:hypothetical protein